MYSNGFILIIDIGKTTNLSRDFPQSGKWTTFCQSSICHTLWDTMQTHHTHYPTNSFVLQRYCPSVAVRDRTEAVSPLMDTSRTRQYTLARPDDWGRSLQRESHCTRSCTNTQHYNRTNTHKKFLKETICWHPCWSLVFKSHVLDQPGNDLDPGLSATLFDSRLPSGAAKKRVLEHMHAALGPASPSTRGPSPCFQACIDLYAHVQRKKNSK